MHSLSLSTILVLNKNRNFLKKTQEKQGVRKMSIQIDKVALDLAVLSRQYDSNTKVAKAIISGQLDDATAVAALRVNATLRAALEPRIKSEKTPVGDLGASIANKMTTMGFGDAVTFKVTDGGNSVTFWDAAGQRDLVLTRGKAAAVLAFLSYLG